MAKQNDWQVESALTETVSELGERCLSAYRANPDLIEEHFGIERSIAEGGYGRRQIYELVQNGADAALDAGLNHARISVVLTGNALYCANEGDPITSDGVRAILGAHRSAKRGNQIGRFGLGFKSVLAVTSAPQFFSLSGSFRFDPRRSSQDLASISDTQRVPTLRIAYPLDPIDEARRDPVLDELMSWAASVVRLPLAAADADWLHADLKEFPAEFMLFSSHVGALVLDDRTTETIRRVAASRVGKVVTLTEDDRTSRWRLLSKEYTISDKARIGAGELADRDTLPLAWAVPMDTTAERGWFWAFFPTEFWTTLRGIINAPWKVNADRQNLLKSDFNAELIVQAAGLVADNVQLLSTADDPGLFLDYLPGRGRESPQWADALLTREVYSLLGYAQCVPDLDGVFRSPGDVRLHPPGLPTSALALFAAHVSDRAWTHPSVDTRSRRPRIERVMTDNDLSVASVSEWFSKIVSNGTASASRAACRIAAELQQGGVTGWETVPFVLTTTGEMVRCATETLFFGPGSENPASGVRFVAENLTAVPEVRLALEVLGIRNVDAGGSLEALATTGDEGKPETWEAFWELARQLPVESTVAATKGSPFERSVRAKTKAGTWLKLTGAILPGIVVSPESTDDDAVVIDMTYHAGDLGHLVALGATYGPSSGHDPQAEPWFRDYRSDQIKAFLKHPALKGRKPHEHLLVLEETGYAGPCSVLERLSPRARTNFSAALLDVQEAQTAWSISHETQDYGVMECANPAMWALRKWGVVQTSLGERSLDFVVGPELAEHAGVLPVATVRSELARQLGLADALDQIHRGAWRQYLCEGFESGPAAFGSVLELVLESGMTKIPTLELADGTKVDMASVVAATLTDDPAAFEEMGVRHVIVSSHSIAAVLCEEWGLQPASTYFTTRSTPVNAVDPVPLIEIFPDLAALDPAVGTIEVVVCEEIVVERSSESGSVTTTVPHRLEGDVLMVADAPGDDEAVLDAILAVKKWQLMANERRELLKSRQRTGGRELEREIRDATHLSEKIVRAIGRDALVRHLPIQVLEEIESRNGASSPSDLQLAEVALVVHGVEILRQHRDDMSARGLEVPSQWTGGVRTREFVLKLGFPKEFAGFRSESVRDPLVHVPGRPALQELHEFQRTAASNIRNLLRSGEGRGLVSLPTGAGKTRTAVQAIVESMRDDGLTGPILWVAQTDELCEQAVSAWSENWRAVGPRETLNVARLWSSNQALELDDPHHVVIATIAKLEVVIGKPEYEWLSRATVVVIDEAHRATSPAYTRLLSWLGLGRGRARIPVVGLTATPFRGNSESDTKRLAARFDGRRLDGFGDDPYGKLQDMGVLARVDHRLLDGSDVMLDQDELEALQKTSRLPSSVLERIGEDKSRNQTILDSILELPDHYTILLFAASVAHAEVMASLLSIEGAPSRAISARTERGARQHYIEQFRRGELRVLTNFGVLTEGFDAPAVRAVFVTRPTYSPNVYQQMIGRGLRGPLNGGKEKCLIVNVEDNMAAYGEKLAFEAFEHLWNNA